MHVECVRKNLDSPGSFICPIIPEMEYRFKFMGGAESIQALRVNINFIYNRTAAVIIGGGRL